MDFNVKKGFSFISYKSIRTQTFKMFGSIGLELKVKWTKHAQFTKTQTHAHTYRLSRNTREQESIG